jgi:glycine/D-amino acid oxidase-like deaminating enzyme
MDRQSEPIVVLGAGAVGICTAAYLQRAGHNVVLIACAANPVLLRTGLIARMA